MDAKARIKELMKEQKVMFDAWLELSAEQKEVVKMLIESYGK